MGKIIVINSGKGGVGKTTLTANLGIALANLTENTVVLDTDLGLRNLDLALGLESMVINDIIDVVTEECTLREAVLRDEKCGTLAFLPASQFKDKSLLTVDKYRNLLTKLKARYDYVLVDSPAGIDDGFDIALTMCDMAIVVVNPDPYSLRDADRVVALCEDKNIEDIRIVINRMRAKMVNEGIMLNIESIIEALGVRLLGVVHEDENMVKNTIEGVPAVLDKKSKSGKAFTDIAKRIRGEKIPVIEIKKRGLKRLFSK